MLSRSLLSHRSDCKLCGGVRFGAILRPSEASRCRRGWHPAHARCVRSLLLSRPWADSPNVQVRKQSRTDFEQLRLKLIGFADQQNACYRSVHDPCLMLLNHVPFFGFRRSEPGKRLASRSSSTGSAREKRCCSFLSSRFRKRGGTRSLFKIDSIVDLLFGLRTS